MRKKFFMISIGIMYIIFTFVFIFYMKDINVLSLILICLIPSIISLIMYSLYYFFNSLDLKTNNQLTIFNGIIYSIFLGLILFLIKSNNLKEIIFNNSKFLESSTMTISQDKFPIINLLIFVLIIMIIQYFLGKFIINLKNKK
ncbi:hypothetical protein OSSY52_11870 [Tepiditoga spiralis]|uniref:Uncharacterized protein n=1 Tax=Tepiditoga spiralis TaxID=2108365 RepID=A0A7G1G6R4_9BACT|nr:hypothetical protein [Tepiditoga spiralis]BBE31046.1 hypothetical protein OSSY52_11870 [Tepiditoga spiralis]